MSKLIIQRTLNGLDTEYKSEGINEHELERLGVLYDERKEIIQINQFDWNISITNTTTQKVISLIRKGNDRAGRAGFYAIRLLVDKGTIINGLFNSLQKIAGRYVQSISQSTLNSQDYTDLLNEIDANTQLSSVILTPTILEKTCYKVVDFNQFLDSVLNDPILELVKKSYLFNRTEQININTFKEFGFTDLELLENPLKKILIENPDGLLLDIIINNKSVSIKKLNETSYQVYVLNNDEVFVKDRYSKTHVINSNPYILKKPEPIESKYTERNSPRRDKESSGGMILIGIFGLILGAAAGYFLPKYFFQPKPDHVLPATTLEIQEPTNKFELKVITDKSQSFVLETNKYNLSNFTFKYDSSTKSWKVRKRTEDSKDDKLLSQDALKEIFGADSALIPVFIEEMENIAPESIYANEKLKGSIDSSSQNSTPENNKTSSNSFNQKKDENSSSEKKTKTETNNEKVKISKEGSSSDVKEPEIALDDTPTK